MSLCTYWKTRVFNSVFSAAYNRTPKYMSKVKIIFVFNWFCVKLNKVTLRGKNVGVKKRKDPISCSTRHSWTRPEEQQLRPGMGKARSQTWKWKLNPNHPEATKAESLCYLAMPRNCPCKSCKQNRCQRAGPLTPTRSESDSFLQCELSNHYDYTDCNWPATPYSCSNPHMETPWDTTPCPLQIYQTTCRVAGQTPTQPQGCFFSRLH